jgi:small subunit ribosomal protein S7
MPRRYRPEKREMPPDPRFASVQVQAFINRMMMYDAMDMIEDKTKRSSLEVFEQAMKNVAPVMEVKPRRVGGATYQVPMEVPSERRIALASRWILQSATARPGKSFSEKLAAELMDAANNTGSSIRKREETHKMAEANRAFSHYRM